MVKVVGRWNLSKKNSVLSHLLPQMSMDKNGGQTNLKLFIPKVLSTIDI